MHTQFTNTPQRNFSLMLDALNELEPEILAAHGALSKSRLPAPLAAASASVLQPAPPSLTESLTELGPLPPDALLLGLASDGLPVLLNLHAAQPGPLLAVADPGTGKTALLQMIAHAAARMHPVSELQFGAITDHPDEWDSLAGKDHCVGVFPTYHDTAVDFLHSLSGWAHANVGSGQSVLLLIDDLESMNDLDFETRQTLRWLLMRGPSRRVWPIVTVNAERVSQVEEWLEAFRTRLFGQIREDGTAEALSGIPGTSFRHLQPRLQFALREGSNWLRFCIPDVG
jgi:hypothetical protein